MFKFLKSSRPPLILLAVVVLLIFLHYIGLIKPIENLAVRILAPIQHRIYAWGADFNSLYASLSVSRDLVEVNKELEAEIESLTVANAQLKILLTESQALSDQTDFLTAAGFEAVQAKVIGKNPEPNLQAIILNKGLVDGIRVDLPLVVAEGIMVGKISKVKANSSEAILINDSRSRIAAMVQNETESKGVIVGEHSLSLKMELIPQNEEVKADDVVVTSGLEPTIPRGLVIGKISRVQTEPNSFWQTAWLQSLVKIDNLTIVSILTSPQYD
jgi:rod shape-determining protein MreC